MEPRISSIAFENAQKYMGILAKLKETNYVICNLFGRGISFRWALSSGFGAELFCYNTGPIVLDYWIERGKVWTNKDPNEDDLKDLIIKLNHYRTIDKEANDIKDELPG